MKQKNVTVMNKKKITFNVDFIGGTELNLRSFEDRRYLRNIFRMPTLGGLKELNFLTIKDWCDMLDYIEEHQQ